MECYCQHAVERVGGDDLSLISSFWKRTYEISCESNRFSKLIGSPVNKGKIEYYRLECLGCGAELIEAQDGNRCCPVCRQGFAIHTASLSLFCSKCNNIVYEPELDAARCHALLSVNPLLSVTAVKPGIGLRGLCNLGNTCYMNSVLQVLAQQAIIRDFYLNGQHNKHCRVANAVAKSDACAALETELQALVNRSKLEKTKKTSRAKRGPGVIEAWGLERDSNFLPRYGCLWLRPWCPAQYSTPRQTKARSRTRSGSADVLQPNEKEHAPVENGCISCELELVIKDMYCGTNARQPLVLNYFLFSTWKNCPHLSGYMQQDAHEFFSFVVNAVHGDIQETNSEKCKCVMHAAFGGMLCSQITCSECNAISKSYEQFFDLSIDCPSQNDASWPTTELATKRNVSSPRRGILTRGLSFNAPPITLESLIQKFLAPETLTAAILCESCNSRKENCSKRMRLDSLPPILCFHIKRFKAGTTPANAQKSDQTVTFPIRLDMSKFVTNQDDPNLYDLCAVIQHTGNIDSGHYFCFILHFGVWYRCDDVFIRRVYLSEVLSSQAYMLFYTRRL